MITWCLITRICGIQHIQRGSHEKPLNMFEAVYFVIVTLSTVGYGDISPDIWLGQLFMLLMICVAFSFIPRQVRQTKKWKLQYLTVQIRYFNQCNLREVTLYYESCEWRVTEWCTLLLSILKISCNIQHGWQIDVDLDKEPSPPQNLKKKKPLQCNEIYKNKGK